jgi:hypothetical protein
MRFPLLILACSLMLAFVQKTDTVKRGNAEYLEWKTLKINNQLPLLCKKADLIKLLGKADSIVTPNYENICVSYFDTAFKYLYYGESQFEVSETMAVMNIIDFESSNIKLVSPRITLDKSLTLEKIKKIFPIAVKNAELIEVDNKGKLLCLKIETSKSISDDYWLLFFKNGKLIRIDNVMPC